jgi:hypothetical protein
MQSNGILAEQAGGKCSDGFKRIMEIEPTELHQRSFSVEALQWSPKPKNLWQKLSTKIILKF